MERARSDAQPKIPTTMLEYAGCFNDVRYIHLFQTYNGQNMYRGYINGSPDGSKAVIFISPALEK